MNYVELMGEERATGDKSGPWTLQQKDRQRWWHHALHH